MKTIDVELLVVPDCTSEAAAVRLITAAVSQCGTDARVHRSIVVSDEQAQQRGFTGSTTILINGADPFARQGAAPALACRLYPTAVGLRGVPELRNVIQALQRAAGVATSAGDHGGDIARGGAQRTG